MPELYIPHGALRPGKNRDGLYVGAVVLVEHTGYGQLRDGVEQPIAALVSHVYPDAETSTDRYGEQQAWLGDRPFIDATFAHEREGVVDLLTLTKAPWVQDIQRAMTRQGVPDSVPFMGYRLVTRLEGIR